MFPKLFNELEAEAGLENGYSGAIGVVIYSSDVSTSLWLDEANLVLSFLVTQWSTKQLVSIKRAIQNITQTITVKQCKKCNTCLQ